MSKTNAARNAAEAIRYRGRIAVEALTALHSDLTAVFHADLQEAVAYALYGPEELDYGSGPVELQAEADAALQMLTALASQQVRLVAP